MKKYRLILLMLAVLLCVMATGCSSKDTDISSIFGDALPDKITSIEVSGYYNGGVLEPWELTREEIEELNAWLSELSLKHRTYAEGETPNEVWNGGSAYQFNVNDGELSFSWANIDTAYIQYDGEWYEIINKSVPPLNLDV